MSALNSVLIIGATSGIGAGIARRLHAQGKKVIATGRRQERLATLKDELPGLETSFFDISDLAGLPGAFSALAAAHPDIDTVIVNAGLQSYFTIADYQSQKVSPAQIEQEVNTNLTGPIVLGTLLVPFFLSRPDRPASIILIGSGLGFVPVPALSIYCATKSAIHAYAVALRAATADTSIKVVEISPPYVGDTELGASSKDRMTRDWGGPDKLPTPMPMNDFLDQTLEGLEAGKNEFGMLHAQSLLEAWRGAFGQYLERYHVQG
jgi:short-subunit dehydrogenase involved in D-alanine esterification of teichoic acids